MMSDEKQQLEIKIQEVIELRVNVVDLNVEIARALTLILKRQECQHTYRELPRSRSAYHYECTYCGENMTVLIR